MGNEEKYLSRMKSALAAGEFKMYLQPKIELSTMEILGAEALVRWDIPEEGMVYPDQFIPLFENSGMIVDLDYYMLEKACQYLRGIIDQKEPTFTISVNFSRVTMYHEKFYETIVETVDRYELPQSYIEIEVTESAFDEVDDKILQTLSKLIGAGFHVSMDDFGAGYSNLNMLSRLPIQIVKMDRAFMETLDQNKKARGIIVCMVDMAHAMGLSVVCEGIEQGEHLRILRQMGCDYAQGYFFSRPIPCEEFMEFYHNFYTPKVEKEKTVSPTDFISNSQKIFREKDNTLDETILGMYPGFLSLRNEQHQIVYLNDNFRDWIREFTDVEPLGKTNIELAAMVPQNVADTFLQCHDASMELQKDGEDSSGLKKIIEFRDGSGNWENTQYLDVQKFWVKLNEELYILTIAYDVTEIYIENMRNLQRAMTDGLTGARNRRYMQAELNQFQGHYGAVLNLNHFKAINDSKGYIEGDQILKEFVSFIRENLQRIASIIRSDGDEFLVIFERGMEKEDILMQLLKMRQLYERKYSSYGQLSFSAGVGIIHPNQDETFKELYQQMDMDKKRI